MRITFLGTGTSHGVPMIDCMLSNYEHCPNGVCIKAQSNPRYRRSRASILVEINDQCILIDTSQDFRTQMFANDVKRIDAVLYTHAHADHIYGLPDIRSYCRSQGGAIDIYGSEETLSALRQSFGYVFGEPGPRGGGIPSLTPHLLSDSPGQVAGTKVTPIPVVHNALVGAQGYRIGNVAYIPDVKYFPESSLALLKDLDLLILNCLRYRPHSTHLSLEESLAYARQIEPKRCLFTHLAHDIDYAVEEPRLPSWASFAYDGLIVETADV